jgi:hypothetical protein
MECVVFGPLGAAVIVGCVLGGGGPVGSNGLLPVAQQCVALYKMLIHKCGGCLTARYCSRVDQRQHRNASSSSSFEAAIASVQGTDAAS